MKEKDADIMKRLPKEFLLELQLFSAKEENILLRLDILNNQIESLRRERDRFLVEIQEALSLPDSFGINILTGELSENKADMDV